MPDLPPFCIFLISAGAAVTAVVAEAYSLHRRLATQGVTYESIIGKRLRLAVVCVVIGLALWIGGAVFADSAAASIIAGIAEPFLLVYGGGILVVHAYFRFIFPKASQPPKALPDLEDIGKKPRPYE